MLNLDGRWLAYAERFEPLLAAYPFLLPLRQSLFKAVVERTTVLGGVARLKDWTRPFLQRAASQIPMAGVAGVDVLFWLDKDREVLVEAIVPVYGCVVEAGRSAGIVLSSALAGRLDLVPAGTIILQAPVQRPNRRKWQAAFSAYRAVFPSVSEATWPTFYRMGQQVDSYEREIRRVLQVVKPRVLVLPVDQFMPGSSAVVVARQLGIPTLVLLHGAVSAYNAPLTADKMGVWGEVSFQQMVEMGVEADKLVILGSPRHDKPPYVADETAKRRLAKTLGLDGDKRIFTFFSNGNDVLRNSVGAVAGCAEWLAEAVRKVGSEWEIAVRLHPNEDGRFYEGLTDLHVYKQTCDLGTVLAGSDMVGALCSTALLEGVLYGVPVVQFWAEGWPMLADNWQRGLARRVASAGELLAVLETEGDFGVEQGLRRGDVFANWGRAGQVVADYVADYV